VSHRRKTENDELDRLSLEEFKSSKKRPVTIILDNIRSRNNVGSVFRTSDAFRIEKICLCGITAHPPHRDIYKTALGATESVQWTAYETTMDAVHELKSEGWTIISIEQVDDSESLDHAEFLEAEKIAFVFGSEVGGVKEEVIDASDRCIEIPQFGTKHSLNISVSVGLVLWDHYVKTKTDS